MESNRVLVVAQLNQLQDPDHSLCSWGFWLFLLQLPSARWFSHNPRSGKTTMQGWTCHDVSIGSWNQNHNSSKHNIFILVWNFLVLFNELFLFLQSFRCSKHPFGEHRCQDLRLLALCPFFRQFLSVHQRSGGAFAVDPDPSSHNHGSVEIHGNPILVSFHLGSFSTEPWWREKG